MERKRMISNKQKDAKWIAINEYNFDESMEKRIYLNLCFRNKKTSLEKELQFNYYYQWKEYVAKKYNNYDNCAL